MVLKKNSHTMFPNPCFTKITKNPKPKLTPSPRSPRKSREEAAHLDPEDHLVSAASLSSELDLFIRAYYLILLSSP